MSKADKMFERLDMVKYESEWYIEYLSSSRHIIFEKVKKIVNQDHQDHTRAMFLTPEMIEAIREKMKELGWLK